MMFKDRDKYPSYKDDPRNCSTKAERTGPGRFDFKTYGVRPRNKEEADRNFLANFITTGYFTLSLILTALALIMMALKR
jgi:hypothetical protein